MKTPFYAIAFSGSTRQYGPYENGAYIDHNDLATESWRIALAKWNVGGSLVCGTVEPTEEAPTTSYVLLHDGVAATPANRLVYRVGYNPSRSLVFAYGMTRDNLYPRNDPTAGLMPIKMVQSPTTETGLTGAWIHAQMQSRFPEITAGDICHIRMGMTSSYRDNPANKVVFDDLEALNPGVVFHYHGEINTDYPAYQRWLDWLAQVASGIPKT